jgi:uncharacterized protein (DUF2126 family)/transglutaminase-like putative cysteine protease
MSIKVALNHQKIYQFDRPVTVGPHMVRLRPSPHCRTPVCSYSFKVIPEDYLLTWRQDPYGNYFAKLNFPNRTEKLKFEVDLIVELQPINPFDFLLEHYAVNYPFKYGDRLAKDLAPFLETSEASPLLDSYLKNLDYASNFTINFLTALNSQLQQDIKYEIRLEEGIQTCEETLDRRIGSCRDTAWLFVQILRHLGLAARFVSGYLIQLAADEPPLDGPEGTAEDTADLHAWTEVYLPGAGWVGLDPTSGMLAAEGHIPLFCSAHPVSAAPIAGSIEQCESQLHFAIAVSRFEERSRVTKPYTDEQWQEIDRLGQTVERALQEADVRLTMGGEPTFVSIDDYTSLEWRTGAMGRDKRRLGEILLKRLRDRFAPGGLLHYGQGKWYPGESLPRWALGCYWRADELPLWHDRSLFAEPDGDRSATIADARRFMLALADTLGVDRDCAIAACDPALPQQPSAYVLPLLRSPQGWISCEWQLPHPSLYLVPGDSPAGYRLPLNAIAWVEADRLMRESDGKGDEPLPPPRRAEPHTINVALCVELRDGILWVFIPPIQILDNYIDLIAAIEQTASQTAIAVRLEGYPPPRDRRLVGFQITPDPGVLEVNLHPASHWDDLVRHTRILYEEARLCRLGTEKFMLDGRRIGTGGGSHLTLGGLSVADSPLLRRPDLLASLIAYWQHHPSLSYLFSSLFVGPTSQAPRIDEARHDSLYELEIAIAQIQARPEIPPPVVDALLSNWLVDVTGNRHRCEFCIDKLYPVNAPNNQWGLLELRAFEMPPHPDMSLVLALLVRALVARFWQQPYQRPFVRWGTALHDKFVLPYYLERDLADILLELKMAGYAFDLAWFAPFLEFRFPYYGEIVGEGVRLELRSAIEPWHVLAEDATARGTARYVDSSMERVQVKLSQAVPGRHWVTCNGYPVPLQPTGVQGEFVAGVRYRARKISQVLHPAIAPHVPLTFDLVDTWVGRAIGGCQLYADNPNGMEWTVLPVNSREAQSRQLSRFIPHGHSPGILEIPPLERSQEYPNTLDLRRVGF